MNKHGHFYMYTSCIVRILYSNNNYGQSDEVNDNDDDDHVDIDSSISLYKISCHNIHYT